MKFESEALANEAAVELRVLLPLIRTLGYDLDDVEIRYPVIFQEGRKGRRHEADIVLFAGPLRTDATSLVVIEAKRPGGKLPAARAQAKSYAANLGAPFLVVCDGEQLAVWRLGANLDSQQVFASPVSDIQMDQLELLIGKKATIAYAASLKLVESTPEDIAAASLDSRIKSATESCLQLLEAAALFRPARCVQRDGPSTAFATFETSGATILPVIGASGHGKTYALASWARQAHGPPRLLVRGEAIRAGQAGIGDLVRESLELGPAPRQAASRSAIKGLVILLDGLNEQQFGGPDELRQSWIPATLQWLRAHSCKLVLSCRPEYWALLQDTFPKDMLQGGEGESNGNAAIKSKGEAVYHLGGFTPKEVQLALSAYGLDGRLAPESATYPLLLAIAEELSDEACATDAGLGTLLRRVADKKVVTAARRLGQPTWPLEIRAVVDALAAELFASGSSWISSARALELFGRQSAALDILVEEHLFVQTDRGLRFQLDLIQEALQVRCVNIAEVLRSLRWVDPLRDLGGWLGFYKAIFALGLRFATYPRPAKLPEPSLAGMALAEAATADSQARSAILAALLPSEYLYDSDLRRWRTAVTIGFVQSLRFVRAWPPEILPWIEAVLETGKHIVDEQVIDSLADALRAPAAAIDRRLEFAPLLFLRDQEHAWGSVKDGLPEFNRPSDDRQATIPALSKEVPRPAARLVESIAHEDAKLVFSALARWLDDPREPEPTGRRTSLSVSRAAAVCLFYLRELDPLEASRIALRGRGAVHDVLLRKFAKIETNFTGLAALWDLSAEEECRDPDRCAMALWLCSQQAMAPQVQNGAILYWIAQLRLGSGAGRAYAARAIVYFYSWHEQAYCRDPVEFKPLRRVLSILEPVIGEATDVLLDVVDLGALPLEREDFFYILTRDFPRAAELIERHCKKPGPDLEPLARGLASFTCAFEIRRARERSINPDPDRLAKGRRVVEALRNAVRMGGPDAIALIAPSVLETTSGVGHNEEYYLTDAQYRELGLLELTIELLEHGDHRIDPLCERLCRLRAGHTRDAIFGVLRRRNMEDKAFGDVIYEMFSLLARWRIGSFEEILVFRTERRADLWDRAAMSWISIEGAGKFDEDFTAVFASPTPASASRDEYADYCARGATFEEAARGVAQLSIYGKQDFLRSLKRRQKPTAGCKTTRQ